MTTNCPLCRSSIETSRKSNRRCSGDNLVDLQSIFDRAIELETSDPLSASKFMNRLSESDTNLDTFYLDFFLQYRSRKAEDHTTKLECDWMPAIELEEFPLPSGQTFICDPIEKRLAEHMLGRELTDKEMYGESKIPVVTKNGIEWKKITILEFPQDFMSEDKSDDLEPFKFDYNALKGVFKYHSRNDNKAA